MISESPTAHSGTGAHAGDPAPNGGESGCFEHKLPRLFYPPRYALIATAAVTCVYRQFVYVTRENAYIRCMNSSNNNSVFSVTISLLPVVFNLFINKKSRDVVTASPSSAATLIDELNNRLLQYQ